MEIIKTEDLVYEYAVRDDDGKTVSVIKAVSGLNLSVEAGEYIAVLGHNGSGKSTFAKHLNVLLKPSKGTVWVKGMDTADGRHTLDIRQTAGMVFQNPDNQLVAGIVEEDVGFGPENIGVSTDEIWKRVTDSLERVDMLSYRYHSPNKLSGGQKQRVAIAGIMAMHPSCIILDEATSMLDPSGREEVLSAVDALNKKAGVTVILITHYMEEVLRADRVFVMDSGQIEMSGTPAEIFAQEECLKALHLGVPQITELAWKLRCEGMPLKPGILTAEELAAALTDLFKGSHGDNYGGGQHEY